MTLCNLISQLQRAYKPSLSSLSNRSAETNVLIVSRIIVRLNHGNLSSGGICKRGVKELWQRFTAECNEKLVLLGEILTLQCNFYAAQRIQRLTQMASLYRNLYNESTFRRMVSRFAQRLHKKATLGYLLGVVVFDWKQDKISSEEMKNCIDEFDRLVLTRKCHRREENNNEEKHYLLPLGSSGWEPVISKPNLCVWRKSVPKSYLYEYKVFGTFTDIPARAFFSVQTDTEYRKKWDKLVIKLDVIDKDDKDGCEVIHWVMHYPFPMYSRDYVYIRKSLVDAENRVMVLVSRAIDHPACPVSNNYVRVQKYFSQMVIRPHRHFDDVGFDYVLTYFDDPEAAFPSPAYNWMASTGVPDFVEKLHNAARALYLEKHASHGSTQDFSQNCNFRPIYS